MPLDTPDSGDAPPTSMPDRVTRSLARGQLESVEHRVELLESNVGWARRARKGALGSVVFTTLLVVGGSSLVDEGFRLLVPVLIGLTVMFLGAGWLARGWGRELTRLEARQAELVRLVASQEPSADG